MIIYRESIGTFISQCFDGTGAVDIGSVISDRMRLSGISYFGESQVKAWNASLPEMARVLSDSDLDRDIDVAVEYKLVQSRDRIDFLICGNDDAGHENVVVVELKQWSQARPTNKQYFVHTFGGGGEGDYWHPSYQAYNYAQILVNFNEYVRSRKVGLPSCSYLHNMAEGNSVLLDDTVKYPLVESAPVFYRGQKEQLRAYISRFVTKPNKKLLYEIEDSRIVPSKYLADMLTASIRGNPFFSYDEAQATSVAQIVETAVDSAKYGGKRTIIIKGGAGTGKSVVAINALGQMIHNREAGRRLNAVYVTANAAPRTLYAEELVGGDFTKSAIEGLFKYPTVFCRVGEDAYDCALVDEAHRLHQYKNISYMGSFKKSAERIGLTTQSDELDWIIHQSDCTIMFYDQDQVVGPSGIDIRRFEDKVEAQKKQNKRETTYYKLLSQMRVQGGNDYIDFVNEILSGKASEKKTFDNYDFKLFTDFKKFDDYHYDCEEQYGLTRMAAGYAWEWQSKKDKTKTDIVIDGVSKRWNYVTEGWLHSEGAIDQVGCIHSTQGYDLNYAFIILGDDIAYDPEKKEIVIRPEHYYDQNGKKTADYEELKTYILNIYYVLMTRGIRGTYLYVCDQNLRDYISKVVETV